MIDGWYYLHINGELILKQNIPGTTADIMESDFAVMMWPLDTQDTESAWRILIEALACGVNPEWIKTLATGWGCEDLNAQLYAKRVGACLSQDGGRWRATRQDFEDLQSSAAGFGVTPLDALASLCNDLGYKPRKTWGVSFTDLLE